MNKIKINNKNRLELNVVEKIILPDNAICCCSIYKPKNKKTFFSLEVNGFLNINKNDHKNQLAVKVMAIESKNTTIDYTNWFCLVNKIDCDELSEYLIIVNRDD